MAGGDDVSVQILGRHTCRGEESGTALVVEQRFQLETMTPRGLRRYPGAKFWSLENGTKVRMIDSEIFEIIETGELLFRRSD